MDQDRTAIRRVLDDARHAANYREILVRYAWLCPLLAIVLAAGFFFALGVSPWTAIVIGVLLACPAVLVWGAVIAARREHAASGARTGRNGANPPTVGPLGGDRREDRG